MHAAIRISPEHKRGCGYRKKGGIYLVHDGPGFECGRLPIPLTHCPCCGHGIKPARGWTWVDADKFLESAPPCNSPRVCGECGFNKLLSKGLGRAGLLWVGEAFYPLASDFSEEAQRQGISRRIAAVPNDFELGQTWVLLAHKKAIIKIEFGEITHTPGIFKIFKPQRIEVIVDGTESDKEIDALVKRGLSPVLVQPIEEPDPQPALL